MAILPCSGLIGRLFGHKFEARFNRLVKKHPLTPDTTMFSPFVEWQGNMEHNVDEKKYQGDVCVRCGMIVNQPVLPNP